MDGGVDKVKEARAGKYQLTGCLLNARRSLPLLWRRGTLFCSVFFSRRGKLEKTDYDDGGERLC